MVFKRSSLSATLLILSLSLIPAISSAIRVAPPPPDVVCESAGGVWDDSRDGFCQPCSLCLSSTGEIREDSIATCAPECYAWCRCPEGKVFTGATCEQADTYLPECYDENPEAVACVESGRAWSTCVSDPCGECLLDSGERRTYTSCTLECEVGCQCPQGEAMTGEGCKPEEQVLPSCEEVGYDDIVESDSCDQRHRHSSLWLLISSMLLLIAKRAASARA
jgi:hypothetical protein